ncbi:hypothetical protein BCON_0111g00120 [Botryotinia convoluta]|uniref:Uncharacterized protein n=1 Tax=Botryotinia convoluta TaxID=54673 RepID=A0A4Z1HY37_9HELO|nr:hypothetical protein BCON_0111g00120 [Botryotinia convoluta]
MPIIEASVIILTLNASSFNVDESGKSREKGKETKKGMPNILGRASKKTAIRNSKNLLLEVKPQNGIKEGILTSETDEGFEKVRLDTERCEVAHMRHKDADNETLRRGKDFTREDLALTPV